MKVDVVESTDKPEELICTAARNDYSEEYIGDMSFEEIMEDISPADHDEVPQEVWGSDSRLNVSDRDLRKMWTLINHLLTNGHYGPFEHPHITFSVEGVSRSLMAQLTRHRHITFDIQSMRYVSFENADPEAGGAVVEIPELTDPGLCGRNAEFSEQYQGQEDVHTIEQRRIAYEKTIEIAFHSYKHLLDLGVAPENARMVLPIGTKVNISFTLNARTLMHVADMRAAADAQWEIREMTEEILEKAKEWCPMTFNVYESELKNRKNRLAP